jgi:glycerol-3-phosphate dehydrogenase (NAD(P)+)
VKATVLGAGSWGTTFAQVLWDAGTPTVLWARDAVIADAINASHENPRYLPEISLPPALTATTDPAAALDGADLVVFAVPAQTLRASLASWAPLIPPGALQVSLLKGIELGSAKRMSEVIMEVLSVPQSQVAVVSGHQPWPGRSPSARSRRAWSPALMSQEPGCCSAPATPGTSGRTRIPT